MHGPRAVLGCLLMLGGFAGPAAAALPTPQVVNGLPTSSWPSAAHLDTGTAFCGATLIGCGTLLTAAHCVCTDTGSGGPCPDGSFLEDPANFIVFLQHAGFFLVQDVRVAPGFEFGVSSDVAVVKLVFPVRGIHPAAINTLQLPPFGTPGTVVGFGQGATNTSDDGVKRAGAIVSGSCAGTTVPDATHICIPWTAPAGPPGSHSSVCFGDSGGPLFADVGAGTTVIGVHSGVVGDCEFGSVVFDADVFVDRAWIEGEAGADLDPLSCGDGAQVGDPEASTASQNGVLSGPIVHFVDVPVGTKLLRVALNAEYGSAPNDFDLFVKYGFPPSSSDFDCSSAVTGSFEYCEIPDPTPGRWYILVDVFSGGPGEYQVTSTLLPANPPPPALVDGDVVLTDFRAWELMQIDPATGDRRILSSPVRGVGPGLALPEGLTRDRNGTLLVANVGDRNLLRIDPATGNRSVVSGCLDPVCSGVVGAGPSFLGPRFIVATNPWQLLVSDRSTPSVVAVVRVDPQTGDRSVVSGCANSFCLSIVGSGPLLDTLFGIVVEDVYTVLVANSFGLVRIDRSNGNRSVVSGCTDLSCSAETGAGPSFDLPRGLAIDGNGQILVLDANPDSTFRALFRVDPVTGDRTIVSGCTNAACTLVRGSGPAFGDGLDMAFAENGDLLVSDGERNAVVRVDLESGDRTLVSGCVDAGCSAVNGIGTHLTEPVGILVMPEPQGWLPAAAVLVALALVGGSRRSRARGELSAYSAVDPPAGSAPWGARRSSARTRASSSDAKCVRRRSSRSDSRAPSPRPPAFAAARSALRSTR